MRVLRTFLINSLVLLIGAATSVDCYALDVDISISPLLKPPKWLGAPTCEITNDVAEKVQTTLQESAPGRWRCSYKADDAKGNSLLLISKIRVALQPPPQTIDGGGIAPVQLYIPRFLQRPDTASIDFPLVEANLDGELVDRTAATPVNVISYPELLEFSGLAASLTRQIVSKAPDKYYRRYVEVVARHLMAISRLSTEFFVEFEDSNLQSNAIGWLRSAVAKGDPAELQKVTVGGVTNVKAIIEEATRLRPIMLATLGGQVYKYRSSVNICDSHRYSLGSRYLEYVHKTLHNDEVKAFEEEFEKINRIPFSNFGELLAICVSSGPLASQAGKMEQLKKIQQDQVLGGANSVLRSLKLGL
jgi:hypothetical protein